ncbi:MAG: KAP family P-loop NTPase fold protein [Methylobacter sp.]
MTGINKGKIAMPMRSHNDSPSPQDAFDQTKFISQIAEVIRHSKPPKGIAINGYWGSGKTSALIQLHKELTGILPTNPKKPQNMDITPVWFEAWRYQNETMPIVSLLQEIRSKFSLWNSFLSETKKLSGITLTGVLGAFDETLKAASGGIMNPALGKIPGIAAQWEKDHYQTKLASQCLIQLLEDAIEKALGGSERKLVIFIDDLDRCTPETALKLLEGIKVYLNLKNCVVIFAMDQRQIENSLRKALNLKDSSIDGDYHAREYLEKICQDIYHLPIPDQNKKSKYLLDLLTELNLGAAPQQQHIEELKKVLDAYDCLPANPRKIKALANRLAVMLRKLQPIPSLNTLPTNSAFIQKDLKLEYGILISVAIIYTFHRRLNEQLAKNPSYINTLINFAKAPPIISTAYDPVYEPMSDIIPSFNGSEDLPVNPSDSHVFRLHPLLIELDSITSSEIKHFLNL